MPSHGRSAALLGALLGALVLPGAASAEEPRAHWSTFVDGNPRLWADFGFSSGDTTPRVEWRVCPPGEGCRPLGESRTLEAGETPAGSVFEADVTARDGTTTHERSPVWHGRITELAPPGLAGELRTGGTLTVTPGQWSGGWGDETSGYALVACPTVGDCEFLNNVTPHTYWTAGPYVIEQRHGGWHVYIFERRSFPDLGGVAGRVAPFGWTPLPTSWPSMTPLFGPFGPIDDPATPLVVEPLAVPAPTAKLRRRALRRGARVTVARVTCPVRCAVRLTVKDRHRTLRRKLHVRGSFPLAIVHGARLRPGGLRVRVSIDGRKAAAGRVRLRA
jgi:hypothetical protein